MPVRAVDPVAPSETAPDATPFDRLPAPEADEEVIVDSAAAVVPRPAVPPPEAGAPRRAPASVVAAIDVGSNSAHGLIAVVRDHDIEPVVDRSAFLGLGWAVDRRGTVGRDKEAELIEALARYVRRAKGLEARPVTVVGTEPLRRSADAARVVRAVEQRCGVPFHVLGHEEEGLLTLIGVAGGHPVMQPTAIVDIGGGSTEVVLASADRPPRAVGVRLGSARLAARFVLHDPPLAQEINAMIEAALLGLAPVPADPAHELIGVGGTASNILRVLDARGDTELTRERLRAAIDVLLAAPSEAVADRYAIKPLRARLLPAGAAILTAALDRFGLERLRISDAGIREGLALASARAGAGWRDRLAELARGWS